jgi:O-antigen ligase
MSQVKTSHSELRVRAIEAPKMTRILYVLTALIFVVFSFWNGLFFDTSFMAASIYWTLIVLIAFAWLKENHLKIIGWQFADSLVFAYFAVFLLSAFWPVNGEYAVLGFVRGISYLFFYMILRVLVSVDDRKQLLVNSLIFSGAVFALYALANGFGTMNMNGAIMDPRMRRLAGNFEYPNTFAIYQAIVFLFAVTMASYVAERSKRKFIYEIAAFLALVSLMLTYSRGTWLALAGMILLLLLLSPKENRGKVLVHTILPLLAVLSTLSLFSKATLGQRQLLGWMTTLGGVTEVTFLVWVTMFLKKRLSQRQWKVGTAGLGILLLVVASIIIAKHGLPQNFVQRIASINFQQFSVVQRFQFYKDGMKILSEHPFLGGGPNAWGALWQRYQSYPYTSRQSHSFLIDLIMDTGIIGFILFIAIVVITFRMAIRLQRKEHARYRMLIVAIIVSLLGLLGHGAIDFDFSYGTINFLMWALIAMLLPKVTVQQESLLARRVQVPAFQRFLTISGSILSLIGMLVAGGYLLSDHFVKKAAASTKDPQTALRAVQNAVDLAPYRGSVWLMVAQAESTVYRQKNSDDLKKKIVDSASNAVSLAPHDPEILSQAGVLIGSYGDGIQGVDVLRQAWENGRYHIQYPEQYISYSEVLAVNLYDKDKSKSKTYFETNLNTYHDVEQRIAGFKNLPAVLKPEYPYDLTPAMRLSAGEAAYYLGEWKEAQRIIEPLLSMKNVKDTDLLKAKALMAALQEKQGKPVDSTSLKEIMKDKDIAGYYERIKKVNG